MKQRSEVYIAVPKKLEKKIDGIIIDAYSVPYLKSKNSPFKKYDHTQKWIESDGNLTINKEQTYAIYEGYWLKWYEHYKDVQEITSLVERYQEDGACIVCVGECGQIHSETGDYEEVFNVYTKVELI